MSAKDAVRSNKTAICRIFSGDYDLILSKTYEKKLITQRDYNNLKSVNDADVEKHVAELVDKIINKGEDTCKDFLKLLQSDDDIKETFPELKGLQLNHSRPLSRPVQV